MKLKQIKLLSNSTHSQASCVSKLTSRTVSDLLNEYLLLLYNKIDGAMLICTNWQIIYELNYCTCHLIRHKMFSQ